MIDLLIEGVFGAIPILAIAWVTRRIMRKKATDLRANLISVGVAAIVGLLIRGFMSGEGRFTARLENVLSFSEAPAIAAGAAVALVLSYLWWRGKAAQG